MVHLSSSPKPRRKHLDEDLVDAIRNAGLEKVTTVVRFVPTLAHTY